MNDLAGLDAVFDGSIDGHVHASPDVWPRRMDAVTLATEARDAGMGGLVLVNHFSETASQAAIVERIVDGITVRGAIKLNRPTGGLNPDAVETVLDLGAVKVDMPTQHAVNDIAHSGGDTSRGVPIAEAGALRPELHRILEIVADSDATIATGHLTSDEVTRVVEAAFEHGIDTPVVSHPMLPIIDLPIDRQIALADQGAVMEYCYINTTSLIPDMYGEAPSITDLLAAANAVGPDSAILATDFGQPTNPSPPDGLRSFIAAAIDHGFSPDAVQTMTTHNPRRVYGIDV